MFLGVFMNPQGPGEFAIYKPSTALSEGYQPLFLAQIACH